MLNFSQPLISARFINVFERPRRSVHADPARLLKVRLRRIGVEAAIKRGLLRFDGPESSVRRPKRTFAL